ncbi:MAG: HAD-IA family hydrolase [Acidobacteriota bacterium]|nr:HAD-IA family hydrolase [Acidobacteriota bacterium]
MTHLAHLKTIFLDAGNTLITMDYERICMDLAQSGLTCTPEEFGRAEAAARPRVSHWLNDGGSTEVRDTFVFYLLTALQGLPEPVRNGHDLEAVVHKSLPLLQAHGRNHELWCRPIAGVPEGLTALRDMGLQCIVVSNSDGTARKSLEAVGIDHMVDDVVDSHLAGFEKPDPRLFTYALERTGAAAETTLHIGDLYHVDVAGARAAGVIGALVDPFDDWTGADCPRFHDIGDLAEKIHRDRATAK